jgi:hypothetical protein
MIACIAGQPAAATYLKPLLAQWTHQADMPVLANHVCCEQFKKLGLPEHPVRLLPINNETTPTLELLQPTLIFSSMSVGYPIEQQAIRWAKERGIPTVQFLDYWSNIAKRVLEHCRHPAQTADCIITIDENSKRSLIAHSVPAERIFVGGQPAWDEIKPVHMITQPQRILILSQPILHHYGCQLGYTEHDLIQGALETIMALGWTQASITLSRHPLEETSLLPITANPLEVIQGLTINRLHEFDLVIGAFSSLLAAALLRGIPTIRFQPNRQGIDPDGPEHQDLIPLATNRRQLQQLMRYYPPPGQAYRDLAHAIQGSGARISEKVLSLMTAGVGS